MFKPAPLGAPPAAGSRRESPRPGVKIVRDAFGVAHVNGKTQADVAYGAGWVTAADRGLLLQLIRGPARVAALDVPGLDPLALALSGKSFVPSQEAEAFLANQIDAVRAQSGVGPKILRLVNAYAAGINGYYASKGIPAAPFTANDVVASAALIAARFGTNGGQEVGNAMFLDALRDRLGDADARRVFADLRESNDPEAPVSLPGSFPQELAPLRRREARRSTTAASPARHCRRPPSPRTRCWSERSGRRPGTRSSSQARRSDTSSRSSSRRWSSRAPASTYGARCSRACPSSSIGRGPDYAWSASSSQADNLDLFVETLCDDDVHYLYRGQCEPMRRFFAGTLKAQGQPDQEISYEETTHGPVIGYATLGGKRVAISVQRSTRGRELLSTKAFYDLDTAQVTSAKDFLSTMNGVEFSFNWFYADDRDIALFSSGRLPIRSPGTDPALPTLGNGDYDWRGFVPFAGHAKGINPASGAILNWNNRPAANVGAADSNFSYGSVHRVDLLRAAVAAHKKHSLATLTGAMNKAATQDLRAVRVWPIIRAVLQTGLAPSARAEAAAGLLDSWRANGSSRLDRELDGKVDDAGAAVMDAAWPRLADAVMSPVLGPLVARLAALNGRSDDASPGGSAYISGWYGYVDKDLRSLLDRERPRPVFAAVLRRRSPRDVPRGALGCARRGGRRARGDAGTRAVVLARGCDQRADSLHVRRPSRHDALDEPADLPAVDVVLLAPPC